MPKRNTNEIEDLVNSLADALVADVEAFPVASAPFGQRPLSQREQLTRYAEVRNNPEAWANMIRERGHREALRYARTMERQARRMEVPNGNARHGAPGDVDQQPDQ